MCVVSEEETKSKIKINEPVAAFCKPREHKSFQLGTTKVSEKFKTFYLIKIKRGSHFKQPFMDMAHIKWPPHYEKEICMEGLHIFHVFYQYSTYTDKQVTKLKKKKSKNYI